MLGRESRAVLFLTLAVAGSFLLRAGPNLAKPIHSMESPPAAESLTEATVPPSVKARMDQKITQVAQLD
jgi:hypothetical protein